MPDVNSILSQCYITIGNSSVDAAFMHAIEHITVESSLHLPDVATIALHDPQLRWVDSTMLDPGASLKIAARMGRQEETIFDGEIVELEPVYLTGTQRLTVRAFDRMHRLRRIHAARSFQNITDEELIS